MSFSNISAYAVGGRTPARPSRRMQQATSGTVAYKRRTRRMPMQRTAPLYDEGNRLLATARAEFTTGQIATVQGNKLVFTVRTATTTLSVVLDPPEATTWAKMMQAAVDRFTESEMAPPPQSTMLNVPG